MIVLIDGKIPIDHGERLGIGRVGLSELAHGLFAKRPRLLTLTHGLRSGKRRASFALLRHRGIHRFFGSGKRFIEHTVLASHLANVGDAKTLVIHPASTTHATMSAQQLEDAGVSEDLVRLSVGLESVTDLMRDIENALTKSA